MSYTTLNLCYLVAGNAAPVRVRSKHVHLLDLILNQTCRSITGYLKLIHVGLFHKLEDTYVREWNEPHN